MKLEKIGGSTYVIKSSTNVGVYIFKNKQCIIIDTGIDEIEAKNIDNVLLENNLKPKYIINTHYHVDHCGGNKYFTDNYPEALVYTSKKTKMCIENWELATTVLFSAKPFKRLLEKNENSKIDCTLDSGVYNANDERFEIISLKGHCEDQIGIITPDKVCFLGDSIFSSISLEKYAFLILSQIKESINTIEYLKEIDAEYFVLSHGNEILNKNELIKLADKNLANIKNNEKQILDFLSKPMTREELLENITMINNLALSLKQYHLYFSTLSAYISYLYDKGLISHLIEGGKLYYYAI